MAVEVGNYPPVHVAVPGRFVVASDRLGRLRSRSFDELDAAIQHANEMAQMTGSKYFVFDRSRGLRYRGVSRGE